MPNQRMEEPEQLPTDAAFYRASIERQHGDRRRFWRVFWLGGASKFILGDLALVLLYFYGFPRSPPPPTAEARVIAALRWHILPVSLFIFSIYAVIIGRALYLRAAYDPVASQAASDETWTIRVNNRILLNLIENYVPFFVATLVAASYIDERSSLAWSAVPCIIIMWTFGRLLYWLGYWYNPWYRVPGFVMSLHFTLYVLSYCVYRIFAG